MNLIGVANPARRVFEGAPCLRAARRILYADGFVPFRAAPVPKLCAAWDGARAGVGARRDGTIIWRGVARFGREEEAELARKSVG